MIGMWTMFYATGGIPELTTRPAEITLHLLAEFLTALMLIIGGVSVLKEKNWSMNIYFFSMGLLLYTLIVSPGYYIQQKVWSFVLMFAAFVALAVVFIILMIKEKDNYQLKG